MTRTEKLQVFAIVALFLMIFMAGRHRSSPDRHEFAATTPAPLLSEGMEPARPTPQRPVEPQRVWRSMRTLWTHLPGTEGSHGSIDDLLCRGQRLFYVSEYEAACLDTSTGKLLWRTPFLTPKEANAAGWERFDRWWSLAADTQFLYVTEGRTVDGASPPSKAPYRLRALRSDTGKVVWKRILKENILGAPCLAGNLLLVPLEDGSVMAVQRSDGKSVWRKHIMLTTKKGVSFLVQASEHVGVAQIGAARLVGFRVSDGTQLWSYPQKEARPVEDGEAEDFALQEGIVYACLSSSELVAIEAKTGRHLWKRTSSGSSGSSEAVVPIGDTLVVSPFSSLVAIQRANGRTVWLGEQTFAQEYIQKGPLTLPWNRDPHASDRSGQALFVVRDTPPLVNGVPKRVFSMSWHARGYSVSSLETLTLLDPATGRELWRWQPVEGFGMDKIVSNGERFFISDRQTLRAIGDGQPDPLPTSPKDRSDFARKAVFDLFDWTDKNSPPLQKEIPVEGAYRMNTVKLDQTHAELVLLRLGRDSVPALVAFVRHAVAKEDKDLPPPGDASPSLNDSVSLPKALTLLVDIGSHLCVPELAQALEHARHPESRRLLAESLIRLGDTRAVPALFRYAASASDNADTRQEALYWVCRAQGSALPAEQVTTFLQSALANRKAPDWLRLFARFELLNNRAEQARQAALSAFQGEATARLLPNDIVLTSSNTLIYSSDSVRKDFPTKVLRMATTRSPSGMWWGAFTCDYLGNANALWFAQSTDGKRWIRPTFGMTLKCRSESGSYSGEMTLRCINDVLEIEWQEAIYQNYSTRKISHHERLALADLSRDSDGDGLTDLTEKNIGTDPRNADTNGNGIPDNNDKNATYRPHALSDEEGIFQAVVEGLCQVGRAYSGSKEYDSLYWPIQFGGSRRPLILRLPQGSAGIRIPGHLGPVLCRPLDTGGAYLPVLLFGFEPGNFVFTPPNIDLAGAWRDPWERQQERSKPTDPFTDGKEPDSVTLTPSRSTFRDYFPYELSRDGQHARVGWEQSGDWWESSAARFDIEVRKIAGSWVPVECRRVEVLGRRGGHEAVLPQDMEGRP